MLHRLILVIICTVAAVLSAGRTLANDEFAAAFAKHRHIMLLIDPANGQIIKANPAAIRFYGYPADFLMQMNISDINALSAEAVSQEIELAKSEKRNLFVFKHRLASGEVRTVEVSTVPILYQAKPALYSIIRDISRQRADSEALWHYQNRLEEMVADKTRQLEIKRQRQLWGALIAAAALSALAIALGYLLYRYKRIGRSLEAEKQHFSEVIWGTRVGTWQWHMPSGKVQFNERWAEIVGYTLEELEPISIETWINLCHPDDLQESEDLLKQNFSGELDYYEYEARMKHKDGHWVWVLDRGKVVERDVQGAPVRMSGTHQEITQRKELQHQLERLAHYDSLTRLPNRSLFSERAEQVLRYAKRNNKQFALLFVDLDGFKTVNDTLGHAAGDAVLVEVAQRLTNSLRKTDTPARLGGDEFAVIVQDVTTLACIENLAGKLIDKLKQPYELSEGTAHISASIGIACYPQHGRDITSLLSYSDAAMYSAKKAGKSCVRTS